MAMMEQDEVRMYEALGFTFQGSFEQEWLYLLIPALCPSFAQPKVEH